MTLPHGTDRLESARLVLRRIAPDDLRFFTRIHALPEVAQHLYPGGRPRSPEETAKWLQYTLASYETARCVRDYARDVLRLPYVISAILPQNAHSRRVAERSGARVAGHMDVDGLTWDRWVWPLHDARTGH